MTIYKASDISNIIRFHPKHQREPTFEQVEDAYMLANNGEIDGALRLVDWKRHCFYVKNDYQREVMAMVFSYCREVIRSL